MQTAKDISTLYLSSFYVKIVVLVMVLIIDTNLSTGPLGSQVLVDSRVTLCKPTEINSKSQAHSVYFQQV